MRREVRDSSVAEERPLGYSDVSCKTKGTPRIRKRCWGSVGQCQKPVPSGSQCGSLLKDPSSGQWGLVDVYNFDSKPQ
jgi:hypothetical protein